MHYWPDKDDRSVVTEMLNDPQSPEWGKCHAFLTARIKGIFGVGYPEHLKEDVVQETLIKVFRHLGSFSYQYSLAAWLAVILTRTAIDCFRRERRGKANVSLDALQDADDEELAIAIETRTPEEDSILHEEIQEALAEHQEYLKRKSPKTAKRDFSVLYRCVLLGQEVKHVADCLRIDRQTIYHILRKAKKYFQLRRKS